MYNTLYEASIGESCNQMFGKISACQKPIVRKGNICPADITQAPRAANKKVTPCPNLEAYGLGRAWWLPSSSSNARLAPSSLLPLGPGTAGRSTSRETRSTTSAGNAQKVSASLKTHARPRKGPKSCNN